MCGNPATTREHIPPDGIYPDPKPPNLITVPACGQCNEGSSRDDQYFIWFVATASSEDSLAKELINKRILKGFRQRPALLRSIMKKATKVNVYSEGGIFLGQQPAFAYDYKRIHRVVDKIVRGLFYHEERYILGSNYSVSQFMLDPALDNKMKGGIVSLPLKNVGGGEVFSYRSLKESEDPRISGWFLMFFDKTLIRAMTERAEN